jgi:hypothetical protein
MGTSGQYGGSNAATWKRVREEWTGLLDDGAGGGSDGTPAPQTPPVQDQAPTALDAIGQALAQALLEDCGKAIPSAAVPLSAFLRRPRSHRGISDGASGGSGGATGAPSTAGRGGGRKGRQAATQAGRGGAAIGAAVAYREGDASALAAHGIRLEDLDGLSPRMKCAKLLDLILGDAGHPDEAAVRKASAEQVKKILNDATPPTTLEALRDFIGEMTLQMGIVELKSQILGGESDAKRARSKERGLRQWIKAKIKNLNLGKYGTVTASQCYRAAQDMFRDAQRLLSEG